MEDHTCEALVNRLAISEIEKTNEENSGKSNVLNGWDLDKVDIENCLDNESNMVHKTDEKEPNMTAKIDNNMRERNKLATIVNAPLQLNWKKKSLSCGLINKGNTCFVNSVIHCLQHVPAFNGYLFDQHVGHCRVSKEATWKKDVCIICVLSRLSRKCFMFDRPVAPEELLDNLNGIASHMKLGEQEDAHDFLICLINKMQQCLTSGIKPKPSVDQEMSTDVGKIFGGFLRSRIVCRGCQLPKDSREPMFGLSLEVSQAYSVAGALAGFFKEESMDGDECYNCATCRMKQPAVKYYTLDTKPTCLVLHLKRFNHNGKISRIVDFDLTLTFKDGTKDGQEVNYRLISLIEHNGRSVNYGHYLAYVSDPSTGEWYCLNDRLVQKTTWAQVRFCQAYILFYIREDSLCVPLVNHLKISESRKTNEKNSGKLHVLHGKNFVDVDFESFLINEENVGHKSDEKKPNMEDIRCVKLVNPLAISEIKKTNVENSGKSDVLKISERRKANEKNSGKSHVLHGNNFVDVDFESFLNNEENVGHKSDEKKPNMEDYTRVQLANPLTISEIKKTNKENSGKSHALKISERRKINEKNCGKSHVLHGKNFDDVDFESFLNNESNMGHKSDEKKPNMEDIRCVKLVNPLAISEIKKTNVENSGKSDVLKISERRKANEKNSGKSHVLHGNNFVDVDFESFLNNEENVAHKSDEKKPNMEDYARVHLANPLAVSEIKTSNEKNSGKSHVLHGKNFDDVDIEYGLVHEPKMAAESYENEPNAAAISDEKKTNMTAKADNNIREGIKQATIVNAPLQLNWKKKSLSCGLINKGNTCFVNSVIQCLQHVPAFNGYLFDQHVGHCRVSKEVTWKKDVCIICVLSRLSRKCFMFDRPVAPEELLDNLNGIASHMKLGEQEDAHEFLLCLINKMQQCLTSGIKPKPSVEQEMTTDVGKIFGGFLRSRIVCRGCQLPKDSREPMFGLSLEVSQAYSVAGALAGFFKEESMDGDECYNCATCRMKQPAVKYYTLDTKPTCLVLHLKRFNHNGKISRIVDFDLTLTFKDGTKDGQEVNYRLISLIEHNGRSVNYGHYLAYVSDPSTGEWYCMNDRLVQKTTWAQVRFCQAYILFYIREDSLCVPLVNHLKISEIRKTNEKNSGNSQFLHGKNFDDLDIDCFLSHEPKMRHKSDEKQPNMEDYTRLQLANPLTISENKKTNEKNSGKSHALKISERRKINEKNCGKSNVLHGKNFVDVDFESFLNN